VHRVPLAFLLLLTLGCSDKKGGPLHRDWAQHPAIVEVDTDQDVFGVGDPHADFTRLSALLSGAGLAQQGTTPEGAQWLGGRAVLVCTGDLIDKGSEGLKVIAYLRALQASAQAAGGQVIVTLGNHEAEFLADPSASKASDFDAELQAAGLAKDDVAEGKNDLGQYLRALPFGARVNDWFFSHAGNTAGASLADLRGRLQSEVEQQGFGASVLSDPSSLLEAKLDPPWWEGSGDPEQSLTRAATALGVQHLAIGHQPGAVQFADGSSRTAGQPYQKFGRIFLMDEGLSRGVDDSHGAVFRIHREGAQTSVTTLGPDGSVLPLWQG
jgi:hypothetical protein